MSPPTTIGRSDIPRAVAAAMATASDLGLGSNRAIVLHASNRIAVRLLPSNVLVRVADEVHASGAEFEVSMARRLAVTGAPIAQLDPRVEPNVYVRDGFVITLWTYYPTLGSDVAPTSYARSLLHSHAGMARVEVDGAALLGPGFRGAGHPSRPCTKPGAS